MHLAALVATATAAAALSVETKHVSLASGQRMQWLSCEPSNPKTHLVCIHGTFHGGWCFAERWLPRLAERHGIAAHSISLRGTAGSPCADKSINWRRTLVMWPRPSPSNCPIKSSLCVRTRLEDR